MALNNIPDISGTKGKAFAPKTPTGVAKVPAPAPPAPPPADTYSGGDDWSGSYGGGGGGGTDFAPIAPPVDTWSYEQDSDYQAQLASIQKALATYDTDYNKNLGNYDIDYDEGMKSLGWNDPDGVVGAGAGDWAREDVNTAAGRGFNQQRNDFASRGMLQSSDYARAVDSLMRSLNDQRGSMEQGRGRYRDDLASQRTGFMGEQEEAKLAAQREAVARRAAEMASF